MRFPKKGTRFALVLGALIAILSVAALAYTALKPDAGRQATAWYHGQPIARCPEVVEVGEASFGDPVTALFPIKNEGHGPLEIKDIRTGCACIGLERRVGDGYEVVSTCTLAPGEEAEFALRFSAVGPYGQPMRAGVQFATNDPERPEVGVRILVARIRAGLTTVPPQIVIDAAPVGQTRTLRLEVRDGYDTPRTVRRVGVQRMPELQCQFTPLDTAQQPADRNQYGTLIGHIDLTLRPDQSGHFTGVIELETGESPPQVSRIPVTGQAVHLVRLAPSAVSLPLHSDSGPLFTARCLYRPTVPGDAKVSLVSAPEPLDVRITPGTDGSPGRIEITLREKFRSATESRRYAVKVRVDRGEHSAEIDIPVTVSP